MTIDQVKHDAKTLVASNGHLLAAAAPTPRQLWLAKVAQRRFERKHFFALESERLHVVDLCIKHTCELLTVTDTALLGKSRIAKLVDKRHIAMTVAYELSGLGTWKLARLFKRKCHSNILYAQKRVNTDKGLRQQTDCVAGAVNKELVKK